MAGSRRPPSLLDLDQAGLGAILAELGAQPYRARQIWRSVYQRFVTDFEAMTDLPASLRAALAERLRIAPAELIQELSNDDGSTTKSLMRLDDGQIVETVLMRYDPFGRRRARKTACVSSQAGCAMGCVFCATGAQGFRRQLSSGEILLQVLRLGAVAEQEESGLTNVVFMGMGEPLANYDALHVALRRLSDRDGFAMSPRRITVSTVGLVPGIQRLSVDHPQVNLAISLHAPDDALRKELVPVPAATLGELIAAARAHVATTGRRVSFEYVLLAGLNDAPAQARALAALLRGLNCHVNLIPINPSPGVLGERPSRGTTLAFQSALTEAGIGATVRVEKGRDILAACGQLRGDRVSSES